MVGRSTNGDRQIDEALSDMKASIADIPLTEEVRKLAARLAEALPPSDEAAGRPDDLPDLPPGRANGAEGQDGHA